jgi:hypothetical protein
MQFTRKELADALQFTRLVVNVMRTMPDGMRTAEVQYPQMFADDLFNALLAQRARDAERPDDGELGSDADRSWTVTEHGLALALGSMTVAVRPEHDAARQSSPVTGLLAYPDGIASTVLAEAGTPQDDTHPEPDSSADLHRLAENARALHKRAVQMKCEAGQLASLAELVSALAENAERP